MTPAEARAELIAALTAAGAPATDTPGGRDAPYVFVTSDGISLGPIVAGQGTLTLRCVMIGGGWDAGASAAQLDELKRVALGVLRGLEGWGVGDVSRDAARDWAGALYLTADVLAVRRIAI